MENNNIEQNIIFSLKIREKNKSIAEYFNEIKITLFDYLCPGKNKNKRKMVGIYNFENDFYRKRMGIVLVFSHLLLAEKYILKNSDKYNYYI